MDPKQILIVIQRSNGDVFLSGPLKDQLQQQYPDVQIDLLVNQDTLAIAKTLAGIRQIYTYDYGWKKAGLWRRLAQEWKLIQSIFGHYDIAINLTASDRSVLYAILGGKISISAVESERKKSWWKRIFLTHVFEVDPNRHVVRHNTMPLSKLSIGLKRIEIQADYPASALTEVDNLSFDINKPYLIFHPGAQYDYKIYPQPLRDKLLVMLNTLGLPIVVSGGPNAIERQISLSLPALENVYDMIGKTSLPGYMALCDHALAYVGMDTLNMHIAAAQNKRIFAIFGPSLPQVWSPWSNRLQQATECSLPVQTYGNITLFAAEMACVACGKAGCDDRHGKSECLEKIAPETIFEEVRRWLTTSV